MYVVIFEASIQHLDADYEATGAKLRELAQVKYGCTGFTSLAAEGKELAVSYWPDLESIKAWKNDPEHTRAQSIGKSQWYGHYRVCVAKVDRAYQSVEA